MSGELTLPPLPGAACSPREGRDSRHGTDAEPGCSAAHSGPATVEAAEIASSVIEQLPVTHSRLHERRELRWLGNRGAGLAAVSTELPSQQSEEHRGLGSAPLALRTYRSPIRQLVLSADRLDYSDHDSGASMFHSLEDSAPDALYGFRASHQLHTAASPESGDHDAPSSAFVRVASHVSSTYQPSVAGQLPNDLRVQREMLIERLQGRCLDCSSPHHPPLQVEVGQAGNNRNTSDHTKPAPGHKPTFKKAAKRVIIGQRASL